MIGTTLAHFKVTAKLGEGGMGEVWRAEDTHLDREVAIKILPDEVASDPERMARFEREAKVLAALDHPNIASIWELAEDSGRRLLVMQLAEGETIDELIARGPLPVDDAVKIAIQIADALESAHERSVIHRDLKPANVKVAPDGHVSVLDFGLAKIWEAETESPELSFSPTLTAGMTRAGVILGTAAYMSPEQARGKPIDKRSDIWAFGVVLYEMLTGIGLYRGETVTDILGAIVHSSPDFDALPDSLQPSLRRLIERCLEPDARDRLRDIGEARYALAHLDEEPAEAVGAVVETTGPASRIWKFATAALLVAAVALFVVLLWGIQQDPPVVVQASIQIPAGSSLMTTGALAGPMRLSPDGRSLTFVAQKDGVREIFVRRLDELEARPVPGAQGGQRPFWSPDGRSLGFFSVGKMRRIPVNGGTPLAIADAPAGRGGLWLPDGTIIFAPRPGTPLLAVAASGGETRQVTGLKNDGESSSQHREPRALPDGRHFLFLEDAGSTGWQVVVGDVEGGTRVVLGPTAGGTAYSQGHLLFLRQRTLMAQPFDASSLRLSGEPTPVAEGIVIDPNFGIGVFTAAESGVLSYQAGSSATSELVLVDRTGGTSISLGERGAYRQMSVSPDGKMLVALIDDMEGASDLWMVDTTTGTRKRFTITPENVSIRRSDPIWSPDGSVVAFSAEHDDSPYNLYLKRTDGTGGEELLLAEPGIDYYPYDFTPDGQWILCGRSDREDSNEDLWVIPISGEGEPHPVFETPFDEWPGSFSPDGRWLAFDSNETGRREIFVIPFDGGTGKWQVSSTGGRFPKWSADGRELYFWDPEGSLIAASISTSAGGSLSTGVPVPLLQHGLNASTSGTYSVDPGGEHFLLLSTPQGDTPISLFLNWTTALLDR